MQSISISVPEVHCQHCVDAIEGALAPMPGVQSVTVDLERRTVDVEHDPDVAARPSLVAAIEDQGYEVAGQS